MNTLLDSNEDTLSQDCRAVQNLIANNKSDKFIKWGRILIVLFVVIEITGILIVFSTK